MKRTFLICLVLLLCIDGAFAHKINIFVYSEGDTLKGYARFSKDSPAKNVKVKIHDNQGNILGEVYTGFDGKFEFKPLIKCDHIFTVNTGDGHKKSWTVKSDELPAFLPEANNLKQLAHFRGKR